MYITCLDMEGVLVPEIWIEFARESGIPELTRTTRDEPNYDKLMNPSASTSRELQKMVGQPSFFISGCANSSKVSLRTSPETSVVTV